MSTDKHYMWYLAGAQCLANVISGGKSGVTLSRVYEMHTVWYIERYVKICDPHALLLLNKITYHGL